MDACTLGPLTARFTPSVYPDAKYAVSELH
jgi:hypothetical protein